LALVTAVEHLVISLPPKGVPAYFKGLFDYSLEEIAELVDTRSEEFKAALSRGRMKLASSLPHCSRLAVRTLIATDYAALCGSLNRRDWDGVRELISADARSPLPTGLRNIGEAPYFLQLRPLAFGPEVGCGRTDGEPVVIILQRGADTWTVYSAI